MEPSNIVVRHLPAVAVVRSHSAQCHAHNPVLRNGIKRNRKAQSNA